MVVHTHACTLLKINVHIDDHYYINNLLEIDKATKNCTHKH